MRVVNLRAVALFLFGMFVMAISPETSMVLKLRLQQQLNKIRLDLKTLLKLRALQEEQSLGVRRQFLRTVCSALAKTPLQAKVSPNRVRRQLPRWWTNAIRQKAIGQVRF